MISVVILGGTDTVSCISIICHEFIAANMPAPTKEAVRGVYGERDSKRLGVVLRGPDFKLQV